MVNPFASILSYIYMCGSGSVLGIQMRIHNAPEYGFPTLAEMHLSQKKDFRYLHSYYALLVSWLVVFCCRGNLGEENRGEREREPAGGHTVRGGAGIYHTTV